jgi:hypothetical protein
MPYALFLYEAVNLYKEVFMAQQQVSQEVHDWLSANGKKGGAIGGQRVKELIEAGKEALGETEEEEEEED